MYWQVYLHKTVLGAEMILMQVLKRAKELARANVELFGTSPLRRFLYLHREPFAGDDEKISQFLLLDDHDVVSAVKEWCRADDRILSDFCNRLMNRRLFKVKLSSTPPDEKNISDLKQQVIKKMHLTDEEGDYYVHTGEVTNLAYDASKGDILFRMKDTRVITLFEASDHLNSDMAREVKKYFICYPKEVRSQ
jgi:HD superfamily phosphohydrolase